MIRWIILSLAVGPLCMAQDAFFSRSLYEPPAGKAAASLAATTKGAPRDLLTTGEKTEGPEAGPFSPGGDPGPPPGPPPPFGNVLHFGTQRAGRPLAAFL